jgi:uncharacterized protein (DUF1778 family)
MKKSSRIEIRVTAQEKTEILQAVHYYSENSVSDFILHRIRPDISEMQKTILSAVLDSADTEVSTYLRDCMKEYLDKQGVNK